jgi:hypothetical protein
MDRKPLVASGYRGDGLVDPLIASRRLRCGNAWWKTVVGLSNRETRWLRHRQPK